MKAMCREEFTFVWRIENFIYCSHEGRLVLISPEFFPNAMRGTRWTLRLITSLFASDVFRTDCSDEYIACYLHRQSVDEGPENFTLNFEIAFLAWNGTILESSTVKEGEVYFKKNSQSINILIVKESEIFKEKIGIYIPQGNVTVRCRMWKHKKNDLTVRVSAVSRLCIEHVSFIQRFKKFSNSASSPVETFRIHPRNREMPMLLVSIMIKNESCSEGRIAIEMIVVERRDLHAFICKIFLLDKIGNKIQIGIVDTRYDLYNKTVLNAFLIFSKEQVIERKNEYLPNDVLSLKYEFCFASGVLFREIVQTEYDFHLISKVASTQDDFVISRTLSSDLISLYNNKTLCNVILETETKTFSAHEIVLCARSPVFKSMLTGGLKEAESKHIEIKDLEDETVDKMLYFLYTDSLQDLQWDTALNLYYAADKYDIQLLKVKCVSFLKSELSTSNASQVLILADMHRDSFLKSAALDYILLHDQEIFGSNAWEDLSKSNPQLLVETMLLKYSNNQHLL
ncbi:BTB and MATH domain-containing protein 43 [Nephila pilipes]|uniref:BTB and MATH domain-containing protein 43 n=1 Tax=Nephila pilipes TaxID=299642 RepID=A0A8X6QTS1_NEPPI|nr:BTB and MATH domain-containing protein 43 [Nephila pilipes]